MAPGPTGDADRQRLYLEAILRTLRQPLVVLDETLSVETADAAFYATFELEPEETVGRNIYELDCGQWSMPRLRELLEDILVNEREVRDFRIEQDFARLGRRAMILNAQRIEPAERILLSIEDVTEREDALRQYKHQKEYAEKIVDASRDALLILGQDLRVTTANATFYHVFSLDPSRTEGRLVYELGDGQWDIPELRRLLENVLPDDETFDDYVIEHDFADIGPRKLVLNARRVDHAQLILLAIEDQTERLRAAEQARESEERYRVLFDSIDQGFCVIEMIFDAAGKPVDYLFLDVNDAFENQTGLKDARGRTMRSFEPEHEEHWFEIYGRIAKTRQPERFEQAAERLGAYYEVYAFPYGPPEALQVGVLFNNVIGRKRAEDALRESEERFQQFGRASPDALWIGDADTLECEYLSPAFEQIYGVPRDEAQARKSIRFLLELILPEDRDRAFAAIRGFRGAEGGHEYRIRRPSDGQLRWLRTTGFPLVDADGVARRLGGITQDITGEKQSADRMEVLLAELQHRTRNLVGVIRAMVTRTIRDSASLEDFRDRFGHRLEALARVNGLLARLEDGARVTFDELLFAELRGHGLTEEDGPSEQVTITGPRGVSLPSASVQTLALALHELLTNSAKYGALSHPEGRLLIAWDVLESGVPRLRLDWREAGGHADGGTGAEMHHSGGYGRELIERALPYQLGAETTYTLEPDGVQCVVVLPIPARTTERTDA